MSAPTPSPLLRLLDAALDLPPEDRDAWLNSLDDSQAHLAPRLRALLARAAEVESRDFLGALPTLPSDGDFRQRAQNTAGTRIGPYRLERQLGAGGMGTVWLAQRADGLYERAIALKLPHRGMFGADLAERMARERSILATLEHPHIARLYEAGIAEDGQPFLALEYVEGLPIDEYCRANSLDLKQRLRLFLQVADAVASAHARLIVHRDLKPANILVTLEGYVRLLDFGIAKLLDSTASDAAVGLTQLSVHAMTPDYASPEQILGQPVTIATDVYSLGVVLYELLCGARPYRLKRDSRGALEDAILQVEPARPSATEAPGARALRGDLDTIVLKSLHKQPEHRYATVNALADDLRRHLGGLPVLAQPDSAWYRASRFMRRNRVAVGVGAVVALTLVGAAITTSVGLVRARAAEQRALAEAATAREVADFLVELFQVSDPGEARGNSVTAREMLDRASLRINHELQASPEIRAELQYTMAEVYAELGLYDEALNLAQASLALRREAEPLKRAAGLEQVARIQVGANRGPQAMAPLAEALALRRRLAPGDHAALARNLQMSGAARFQSSQFDAAMALLTQAQAELARLDRPDPEQLGGLLKYIAYLHHERADYGRAAALYRQAVQVLSDGLGGDHPAVAGALGDLAVVLKDTQQFDEAERNYLASLAIQRKILGNRHRDVGDSLNNLAILYMDQGNFTKGLATAQEGTEILRASLGEENDLTCTVRLNAARALTQLGRLDEAEREYRAILEIRRRTLQPANLHLAVTIEALADVLNRQQRFPEALPLAREAREKLTNTLGPDSWRIASNGRVLGAALTGLKRYPEAEQILRDSYHALYQKRGPTHRTTLLTATRLASLYELWGRPAEMKEWQARGQP